MDFNSKLKQIKGAVPGQSFTDKMGDRPYNRPPRYTRPEAGVQAVFEVLTSPKGSRNIIIALRNGASATDIADSIGKMMHGEGLMAPQAIPLMAPAVLAIIENIAEIAGVPTNIPEEKDPWTEPDPERVAELAAKLTGAIDEVQQGAMEDNAEEAEPVGETPPMPGLTGAKGPGLMTPPGGGEM